LRRKGIVGEFVSVYLHDVQRAVYIATDGGRVSGGGGVVAERCYQSPEPIFLVLQVCRPLLVVDKGIPRLTNMALRQLASGLLTLSELIRDG